MQESRLFRILYYLVDKGKVTAPDLAEKFEVSVRTIYRDIDVISSAGIPIYATTGRNGGIQIANDFIINKTLFSEQEKKDILTALQSVSVMNNSESETLIKLAALFKVPIENWLEIDFSRWGHKSQDNQTFQKLKHAIIYRNIINITYINTSGNIDQRNICPIKMIYKSKEWYVKSYCLKKSDFRIFKITRIIEINQLNETFEPLEYPLKEESPQIKYDTIVLRFSIKMAYRIYDEFETKNVKRVDNNSYEVSAKMPIDDWLVGYLLSFGTQVTVIEPSYLKKILSVEAQKIYEHYKT